MAGQHGRVCDATGGPGDRVRLACVLPLLPVFLLDKDIAARLAFPAFAPGGSTLGRLKMARVRTRHRLNYPFFCDERSSLLSRRIGNTEHMLGHAWSPCVPDGATAVAHSIALRPPGHGVSQGPRAASTTTGVVSYARRDLDPLPAVFPQRSCSWTSRTSGASDRRTVW